VPSPQRPAMTSQGTAHGRRFQRAIQRKHLHAAEMAARELGGLSLADALDLTLDLIDDAIVEARMILRERGNSGNASRSFTFGTAFAHRAETAQPCGLSEPRRTGANACP
jgi:hypothetical protein